MVINSSVVAALLALKELDWSTAARLVHAPFDGFCQWMGGNDARLSFETQLDVLALLGIRQDAPRGDVVHYWRVHEPLFSRSVTTYAGLRTVVDAFGPACVTFIAQEADPIVRFNAKAHFALQFSNFLAILEITAHPLRTISFDPGATPGLSWSEGAQGILLGEEEYAKLEPGALNVRGLERSLLLTSEMKHWERLRESAAENGLSAEAVAQLLLGNTLQPRLSEASSLEKASGQGRAAEPAPPSIPEVQQSPPRPEAQRSADLFTRPVPGAR